MQSEHWKRIANSRHKIYVANFLGQLSFLKQQIQNMMPEPLQSHPSVCGFFAINVAFHLIKFRQEEIIGVPDVNILSFIKNYMFYFNFYNVYRQVVQCIR